MRFLEALDLYLSDQEITKKVDNGHKRIHPYVQLFTDERQFVLENGPHFSPRWVIRIPSEDLIKRSIQIGSVLNDSQDIYTGLVLYAHDNTHTLDNAKTVGMKLQTELNESPELIIPMLESALEAAIKVDKNDLTKPFESLL